MEVISKRKLDDTIIDDIYSFKKHKYEEEEFSEPYSPMDTPHSSPSRSDVVVCLPRNALDFNELQELITSYSVVSFSFISWRNSEPLVLLKKVNSKWSHYIIAHKLNDKWVKTVIPTTTELFDRIQYLGNGNYLLTQLYESSSCALIFKPQNFVPISNSVFSYEAVGKLVRYLNLGKGQIKSIQTNEQGIFAITTFNESFGQCRVFSKQGVVLFDFNLATKNSDIPSLNEPYAINLDVNFLYLYYWDSFPLVRIDLISKKIDMLQSELPIVFSHHVAINNREAIFAGGFPRSTSMLSLTDKEKGLFRVDLVDCEYEEFELVHELTGERLYCVDSQGSKLYLRSNSNNSVIYSLTLGVDL